MPIDVTLLRSFEEGGNPDQVKQWQLWRCTDGGKESEDESSSAAKRWIDEAIAVIQEADQERRNTIFQLNQARSRVRMLQQSLAPLSAKNSQQNAVEIDKQEIKKEAQELKRETIPTLEKRLDGLNSRLHESLVPQLGNMIDPTAFHDDETNNAPTTTATKLSQGVDIDNSECVMDPLFCLGFTEYMPTTKENTNSNERISVLTSDLGQALTSYAQSYFRTIEKGLGGDNVIHLPSSISISQSMAHSVVSCTRLFNSGNDPCPICGQRQNNRSPENSPYDDTNQDLKCAITAPSYIAACMLHSNKSYSDRQLPLLYTCLTQSPPPCSPAFSDDLGHISFNSTDKRAKKPLSSKKVKSTVRNFQHTMPRVELFGMTASSIVESRNLQNKMVHALLDFYASLLVPTAIGGSQFSPNTGLSSISVQLLHRNPNALHRSSLVRARMVSPLAANEARRIVVEGYMPAPIDDYIVLAYVSNLTDYVSREFKTRCIGGYNGAHMVGSTMGKEVEYVHTIHGTLCDVGITMEWLVQNNVMKIIQKGTSSDNKFSRNETINGNEAKKESSGVGIPICLGRFMHVPEQGDARDSKKTNELNGIGELDPFLYTPFRRRLLRGKKDKINCQELHVPTSPHILWPCPDNRDAEFENRNSTTIKECIPVRENHPSNDHCVEIEINSDPGTTRTDRISTTIFQPLSKAAITAEAMSNPYDFLPFFET
eukprot:scaffold52962_cov54-Attheya_sp.AAC.2